MLGFRHQHPSRRYGSTHRLPPPDPVAPRTPTGGGPSPQGRRSAPSSGPTSAPRGAWPSGRTMPGPLLSDTPGPWAAGDPRPGAGPTGLPPSEVIKVSVGSRFDFPPQCSRTRVVRRLGVAWSAGGGGPGPSCWCPGPWTASWSGTSRHVCGRSPPPGHAFSLL